MVLGGLFNIAVMLRWCIFQIFVMWYQIDDEGGADTDECVDDPVPGESGGADVHAM